MINEMNEIVVGHKSRFSLTCEIDSENPREGCVYIYIDGKKFGNSSSMYELDFFLWHAVGEFSGAEFYYPFFYSVTAFEMIAGIDQLYSDEPNYELCVFEQLAPGFIRAFEDDDDTDFHGACAEEIVENILQRGGNYGFNFLTIALLSNGKNARLFIGEDGLSDEEPKYYQEPERYCESVELELGEFHNAFKCLYGLYRDRWPEYAKRFEE